MMSIMVRRNKTVNISPRLVTLQRITAQLPVEMTKIDAAIARNNLTRNELPMRNRISGKMRKIAKCERTILVILSVIQNRKPRRPMMTKLLHTTPPFRKDNVSRDVPIKIRPSMSIKNRSKSRRKKR